MKKVLFLVAILIGLSSIVESKDINNIRKHKRCKGLSKEMLKPKNNWKSYVRYR